MCDDSLMALIFIAHAILRKGAIGRECRSDPIGAGCVRVLHKSALKPDQIAHTV